MDSTGGGGEGEPPKMHKEKENKPAHPTQWHHNKKTTANSKGSRNKVQVSSKFISHQVKKKEEKNEEKKKQSTPAEKNA